MKNTNKALFSSVVALILCCTMLVGSTFAWFTDSASSAVNTIQAGNLNIVLEYQDANGNWVDAEGQTLKFTDNYWEPGCTYKLPELRITNKGNLALKYDVVVNGIDGDAKLLEAIEFTLSPEDGTLLPDDSVVVELSGHMAEEAGNEYQGLKIEGIGITVYATQYTHEQDSNDDQYDVNAEYLAEVKTAAELANALSAGKNVKLINDISVTETLTVPAGVAVELDLNGKTITGTEGRDADNNRIHVIVNNGILTIKDGTVKSAGNDGGSAIYNNAGATLTIEDVTLYGAPQSDPVYEAGVSKPFPSYAVNNYGNAVVNGATVKSYHGAIATGGNGVTVINDADIDVGLGQSTGITSYAIYSYENAQVTVNGGKFAFTKQEIYVNGGNTFCELGTNPIIINGGNYIGTSFSTGEGREYVIKGGTFDADPSAYVADGLKAVENGSTYYVVSDEIDVVVTNPADLAAAIAQGGIVYVANDIDMNNAWTSVKPNAELTILGNGKTITNLNLPLLAGGVSTKVTFKGLTVADSNVAPAAFENGLGTGAFVPYVDAYGNAAFEDCHLVNSTVTGNERAGGFIGYTSGQTLSFKNCTVDKCEISAVGGAAGFVAYSQTATTIDGCSVTNTKVTATEDRLGTKAALAGSVIGTVNADTVINNVTASGNTVSNNNALPAFSNEIGRKVAGVLTIDGKTVVTDASNLANGGNLVLGGDVQYGTAVKNDTVIDLDGNTFEATGSYNLSNNADFTMTNGDYVVNSTYGHIDVRPDSAEGSVLTFENVDFTSNYKNKTYGTCTDRLVSVLETAPEAGAHIVVVFKNCTFDNAKVLIEGMSGGAGTFEVTFEDCTFNALTSSAPIEVMNYMKGTITVKNCTFNLECTSASASAIAVSPSPSTEVTIVAENNTINATAAIASGESGTVEQVKVLGTPANIKFISAYDNTTVTETNTTKTGIAK